MTESNVAAPSGRDPFTWALALVAALTLVRLVALFTTPLELYPDEAQYWLWSRTLDFGYFSKPPMVAWLIALTTGIGGNDEAWVRVSSLWLHAGTALFVFGAAARLYDRRTGFWAAALYCLMPGVQLSSGIVSTDASLLFFLSAALYAYARLQGSRRPLDALGLGVALGLAFLSKYAALYFLIGVVAHLIGARAARQAWSVPAVLAAVLGFALMAAPNVIWNATHGFETVAHTASNAGWSGKLFHPAELGEFLVGQLGVFGPIPFVALVVIGIAALRRKGEPADGLLWCFVLPPLLIVTLQALISKANANWAAAAYVPACALVAGVLLRRGAGWLKTAVVVQALIATLLIAVAVSSALADRLGFSNGLKRARGWEETANRIGARLDREAGLTAIAVDDRFLFNALAYYGRDRLARPGAPPLKIWVRGAAGNQAETTAPLTEADGSRVLVASIGKGRPGLIGKDFAMIGPVEELHIPLDKKRTRDVVLFVGEDFKARR
jgi:4-amino-4-deoxy-L-arabinose transferase-like glycosyltransferase